MANQNVETTHQEAGIARPITVLLVDDQRFVGMAVQRLLAGEADITLHCCLKANDAIGLANTINPTIILQDLILPDIDGMTMIRLFRENPATAATPVIVLSGNDDAEARARALAGGARDYLVKLPEKDAFLACIRRHVAASDAAPSTSAVRPAAAAGAAGDETLDRSVLSGFRGARAAGAPDFTIVLIDGFIAEATAQVKALRTAGQNLDARGLAAAAHSLKGSSMTIGARRLAAFCVQVEERLVLHSGAAMSLELMTAVDRELINVQNALVAERQSGTL